MRAVRQEISSVAFCSVMKKQIFCVSIILLVGLTVSAQTTEKAVEKIRAAYSEVAEKALLCEASSDRGEFGELVMNELTINKRNHQWRAVGIYQQTYKFFYKGGDTEEHIYPDQLVMVKVERRESDRTYSEEYLFSDAGMLLFYYQKAENDKMVPNERRAYFSGVTPIRVIEDGKTRDRFAIKSSGWIKGLAGESAKIKDLFQKSLKL